MHGYTIVPCIHVYLCVQSGPPFSRALRIRIRSFMEVFIKTYHNRPKIARSYKDISRAAVAKMVLRRQNSESIDSYDPFMCSNVAPK